MTDHLSPTLLNALADGELSTDQLATASEHLARCPSCTSSALYASLLKSATAKAGQRYAPLPHRQEQLSSLISKARSGLEAHHAVHTPPSRSPWPIGLLGWATAAVFLLVSLTVMLVQSRARKAEITVAERTALMTEVCDQHIAWLATNLPPQVLSSDRHTVKPWFQGKIPFSFNLPASLPRDTTLDGANLTYLHNHAVAQLLFSIGRHRVSVFVQEKPEAMGSIEQASEHSGFHVMDFSTDDLEVVAVSDVEPARLAELISAIRQAQTVEQKQSK